MHALLSVVLVGLAATMSDPGANAAGEWIELIGPKDLSLWRQPTGDWMLVSDVTIDPKNPQRLAWKAGTAAAVNGPQGKSKNLISVGEFGDVELHV